MSKNLSYDDDFEMLTLRHEYLKKIPNPESVDISEYKGLVKITAKIMYDKCRATFEKVGFDLSDIESIAMVYMFAYSGLYSFSVNEASKERFYKYFLKKTGKEATARDAEKAEKNVIINFLRQKLHHCSKVCERKSRNIVASRSKRYLFAYTKDSTPSHPSEITQDYKKNGYRKVGNKEYLESKIKAKESGVKDLFDKDGFRIVEVNEYSSNMYGFHQVIDSSTDGAKDEYEMDRLVSVPFAGYYFEENPDYLSDPEISLDRKQTELENLQKDNMFSQLDNKQKKSILKKFIDSNSGSLRLKEELKTARAFLKQL